MLHENNNLKKHMVSLLSRFTLKDLQHCYKDVLVVQDEMLSGDKCKPLQCGYGCHEGTDLL